MKPTELLTNRLTSDVVPLLTGQYGFRFARSSLKVSRKTGDFEQSFQFSISKYSADDLCIFWTMWSVSSRKYSRWHEATWGEKPANDSVAGCAEWNIPNWTRSTHDDHHLTLTNTSADNAVIAQLLDNIEKCGIPYVDRFSAWEPAAEQLVSKGWMYDRAADFYLIAGNQPRANAILLEGIKKVEAGGSKSLVGELTTLQDRLDHLAQDQPPRSSNRK